MWEEIGDYLGTVWAQLLSHQDIGANSTENLPKVCGIGTVVQQVGCHESKASHRAGTVMEPLSGSPRRLPECEWRYWTISNQ